MNNLRRVVKVATGFALVIGATTLSPQWSTSVAAVGHTESWLDYMNQFRAESGLAPVVHNPEWDQSTINHSCYVNQNGITHYEIPGKPGYTPSGEVAGLSSNLAVVRPTGSDAADRLAAIDQWMAAPFHAMGILHPNLTASSLGMCPGVYVDGTPSVAATLDVVRGRTAQRPPRTTTFPGPGATTNLSRFISESPDPTESCPFTSPSWGVPLIAMFPTIATDATATLTGPNVRWESSQLCVLDYQDVNDHNASITTRNANAVVVIAPATLADGAYTATVNAGGQSVTWSFNVQSMGFNGQTPERLFDSRSSARVANGGGFALAVGSTAPVALNVAAVRPTFYGWLGAYPCATGYSGTSNLNFAPGETVANFVIVQPDQQGRVCFVTGGLSPGSLDVLVDRYGRIAGHEYQLGNPVRLFDSRSAGGQIPAKGVKVLGGFTPASTQVLNLTVGNPAGAGFLTVYPCSEPVPTASATNYKPGSARAALTLATADGNGNVCVFTSARTTLVVDRFGQMQGASAYLFTPTRLKDTRSRIGGTRGRTFEIQFPPSHLQYSVPMTVTAVGANGPGFVTAYPCAAGQPLASIVNFQDAAPAPNLLIVVPDADGKVCFSSSTATNLIVDHYGYLTTF